MPARTAAFGRAVEKKAFPAAAVSCILRFCAVADESPVSRVLGCTFFCHVSRVVCRVHSNKYIDFVGTWGPAIVGHADDEVLDAIKVLNQCAYQKYPEGGGGIRKYITTVCGPVPATLVYVLPCHSFLV